MKLEDYWWEGNDLKIRTPDGEIVTLQNAYIQAMEFKGIDVEDSEEVIVEPTSRYYNKEKEQVEDNKHDRTEN